MEQGLLVEGSSHLMASFPCEAQGQALHLSLFTIESTDNGLFLTLGCGLREGKGLIQLVQHIVGAQSNGCWDGRLREKKNSRSLKQLWRELEDEADTHERMPGSPQN